MKSITLIKNADTNQQLRKLPPLPCFVIGKDSEIIFIVTEHTASEDYVYLRGNPEGGKWTLSRSEKSVDIANEKGYRFPLPGEKIVIEF